jgi:predicted alpha/beta hydrolase family esterase
LVPQDPSAIWVEHASWDDPAREEWVQDIARAVDAAEADVVMVAHSLGCLAILEWARTSWSPKITGLFLVSVPNPAGDAFPVEAQGFAELRLQKVAVPTIVVSSSNDPYGTVAFHSLVSDALGAELVDVGALGHVNATSGLGSWPEGRAILDETLLIDRS